MKKNSKHKADHPDAMLPFKNLMRGQRSPRVMLSQVRELIAPSLFPEAISWIRTNQQYVGLFNPNFPSDVSRINEVPLLGATDLHRELRWAKAYLVRESSSIAQFVDLSTDFQKALMSGDWNGGWAALNKIEKRFGQSFWLVKNKIAFLQVSDGIEAQKKYTIQVRKEAESNGIVSHVAFYSSVKCEPSVSFHRFVMQYTQRLSSVKIPTRLRAFLQYHIAPNPSPSANDINAILGIENVSGIIDYYETLMAMSQAIISRRYEAYFPDLALVLKALLPRTGDRRIRSLLIEFGELQPTMERLDLLVQEAFNDYLQGNFASSESKSFIALNHYPACGDLLVVAARARALQAPSSPSLKPSSEESVPTPYKEIIVSQLESVLRKDERAEENLAEVYKAANCFSAHPWASAIAEMADRESTSSIVRDEVQSNLSARLPTVTGLTVALMGGSPVGKKYAEAIAAYGLEPSASYSMTRAMLTADLPGLESLSREERILIDCYLALETGDLVVAMAKATEMEGSAHEYYTHKGTQIRCHCLLGLGRLGECVSSVTSAYLDNPYLHMLLQIEELSASLSKQDRLDLATDISLPILLDMYSDFVDPNLNAERGYAYEDFLLAHGIERPSQIATIINKFDQQKVIYFLRYICVEPIMDCSTIFQGSHDIKKERLEVCRILVGIDPDSAAEYQKEIKDIHRQLVTETRLREVEQSRVYVDIDSIRRTVEKSMRETFNRYTILLKHGMEQASASVVKTIRENSVTNDVQQVILLNLPQNEMNDLLESMVAELRDEYITGTEHGLNGYLSVRIRHGTLSNQLRSPLEACHLVTQRDGTTGSYKPNTYWTECVGLENDPRLYIALDERFAEFSRDFDQFIQGIISEVIQVKRDPEGKGLFDFTLTKTYVAAIASNLTKETTFDDFVDLVVGILDELLNKSLSNIRHVLGTEIKSRANSLLTLLQSDLENLNGINDTGSISDAIGMARTNLQLALDRVIAWFHQSKAAADEPFQIEDGVRIGVESVRTFSPGFRAQVKNSSGMEVILPGHKLISFVDILFIILENVIRHSGLSAESEADINIGYDGKALVISVENEVAKGVATDAVKKQIDAIKSAVGQGDYRHSVTREGGTGFHKIWKILTHDFHSSPDLQFGFANDNRFLVTFKIWSREIIEGSSEYSSS